MRIAIIGAGAAGLTAAYRLTQAGHRITVFEAQPYVGGRAHTEHFAPGHYLDGGARTITTAYTRTLALLDEIGEREQVEPARASTEPELLVNGKAYRGPGLPRTAEGQHIVPAEERARLRSWLEWLEGYPPLGFRTFNDQETAEEHLKQVSPAAAKYLFEPMFGGLHAPLSGQSAEFVRSWVAASRAQHLQLPGGMDAPWKRLASHLDVRLNARVEMIRQGGSQMEVVANSMGSAFGGIIVAVPPPVGKHFVTRAIEPRWVAQLEYEQIAYSGQCRLYLAMPGEAPARIHRRPAPMGLAASVEWQSADDGAWGRCPPGWQWALISGNERYSRQLIDMPDEEVAGHLWSAAEKIAPGLPPPGAWAVRYVLRWEHAMPTMAPGHFTRLAAYQRHPPLVFAGDWTHQACIEGAVRSGEAAAVAFGPG